MSADERVEVLVVGGGPAGTTTALYTTRLGHETLVCERAGGRHAAVAHVHNLYGVSEDVSGRELAAHARDQLQEYGGHHRETTVTDVSLLDDREASDADARFRVDTEDETIAADRVVIATGFTDRGPHVPGLERFAGRGLHYCLHCDAFGLGDAPVYVLGHDDHAAEAAMLLLNFTDDVDLLLNGHEPAWDDQTDRKLASHPIERVDAEVVGAFPQDDADERFGTEMGDDEPWLGGLRFADGTERSYRGGFAMYGTAYETDLAEGLGCQLADDGALVVDDSQETSVDGAYAVGDVTHGQNQTTIAMADGARAGIAIHKDLRTFPRDIDGEGELVGTDEVPAASDELLDRMHRVREREVHAGLRDPSPRRE